MLSEKSECFEIEYARLVDPKTRAFGMQSDQIPPRQLVANRVRSGQKPPFTVYLPRLHLVECRVDEDVRFFPSSAFSEIKPLHKVVPAPTGPLGADETPNAAQEDTMSEQAEVPPAVVEPVFDPNPGRLLVPAPPEPNRKVGRPRKE